MMGAETQINIKPQIVDTSEEAIKLFNQYDGDDSNWKKVRRIFSNCFNLI